MNLQTGRICCLILILLASLETKAQVALEENNIEQYAALQLGYDSIGGNIKAQIKKQALIAALQGGIYREQRRIRKWKGAYQDYLSNERNVGKALAAGKNLYIQALADALNLDVAVISNIEKGKRDLRVKELEIISNVLGLTVVDLLTYPQQYVNIIDIPRSDDSEVSIQIKLKKDKRDQVMRLIFGDNDIEILNK